MTGVEKRAYDQPQLLRSLSGGLQLARAKEAVGGFGPLWLKNHGLFCCTTIVAEGDIPIELAHGGNIGRDAFSQVFARFQLCHDPICHTNTARAIEWKDGVKTALYAIFEGGA